MVEDHKAFLHRDVPAFKTESELADTSHLLKAMTDPSLSLKLASGDSNAFQARCRCEGVLNE